MSIAQEKMKTLFERPVLIYGAGMTGRRAAVAMRELGVDVVGVAVTSMGSNVETLEGFTVKELGQWQSYAGKAAVLIAMFANQKTVVQTCKSYGFEDVIVMDQVLRDEVFCLYFKPVLARHGVDLNGEFMQMGGGFYLNPFTRLERDAAVYVEELGDFILPSIFDEWTDVSEGPYELGDVKVSPGDIVFDLGANYGVFSVYAASCGERERERERETGGAARCMLLSQHRSSEISLSGRAS